LDHISDYLQFLTNSKSYWFTLNTSYDHGCHLANLFCLDPDDYEVLIIIAGLASYMQFGFAIKPTAWKNFFGGHQFASYDCVIEFKQKKIDLDAYISGTLPSQLKLRQRIHLTASA
jgi:hypothetical protein